MEITEHIAQYLRAIGFETAASGTMPAEPDRTAAVYATGVRPPGSEDGSRFQIITRASPQSEDSLADAGRIAEALEDFTGILTPGSPWIQRIILESGITAIGADDNRRLLYSANYRAWYC